ncbi:MAG: D-alanyl-D-alanine carboxypeptidase [bacterium]|nr:D-alanyl-D-alanine carboxypeptidase [bacterium]MDE0352469.1 D-alanyl-D-alanine carboxypeptidase [bacterium]
MVSRLWSSRSRTRLVPASLMKVATAAAAFEVMSPDEVFTTEVFARTEDLESVTNGVLTGDVYLVGQGDPVLSTPRYVNRYAEPVAHTDITGLANQVMAALSARGIRRIEGRIVGDESWYPDKEREYSGEVLAGKTDPVWRRSFVTANHSGPLSALLLNSGFSRYASSVFSQGRRQSVRAAVPAQHAASVFDDFLEARRMVITRRPVAGVAPVPSERTMLGAVDSPPLSEIVGRMLTRSDNTIAEMLLKEIGRRGEGSDRASAVATVHALLRGKLGSAADGLLIADGSGLSYHNRLTCGAVAGLLEEAGPGSPLVEGLAVAGRTGTLRNCHPARSRGNEDQLLTVKGKTGSLDHVISLAGTAVAAGGETITFSMIANQPNIILLGSCNRLRRTLLNAAANYTYGPAPAGTPVHAGDRAALAALFDSTGGDGWFNMWSWKTGAPLSRWHGVTTDSAGRVTGIDLSGPFGNGLTGSIPEELGRLSELVRLDLSGNDLCVPRSMVESLPSTGVGTCSVFVDAMGNTHEAALEALAGRGILDGTECAAGICPNDAIKRWTMAVWLVRAIDGREPPAVSTSRFADVDTDDWWLPYVERLAELRITAGCAVQPFRFCPDRAVSREEMASFLKRAFALDPAPPAGFRDTGGSVHKAAIDALWAAGITAGCQTNPPLYCPSRLVTRAEMATFLARSLRLN